MRLPRIPKVWACGGEGLRVWRDGEVGGWMPASPDRIRKKKIGNLNEEESLRAWTGFLLVSEKKTLLGKCGCCHGLGGSKSRSHGIGLQIVISICGDCRQSRWTLAIIRIKTLILVKASIHSASATRRKCWKRTEALQTAERKSRKSPQSRL